MDTNCKKISCVSTVRVIRNMFIVDATAPFFHPFNFICRMRVADSRWCSADHGILCAQWLGG